MELEQWCLNLSSALQEADPLLGRYAEVCKTRLLLPWLYSYLPPVSALAPCQRLVYPYILKELGFRSSPLCQEGNTNNCQLWAKKVEMRLKSKSSYQAACNTAHSPSCSTQNRFLGHSVLSAKKIQNISEKEKESFEEKLISLCNIS